MNKITQIRRNSTSETELRNLLLNEFSQKELINCVNNRFEDEWKDIIRISNLSKEWDLDHNDENKILKTIEDFSQKLIKCNHNLEPPSHFTKHLRKLGYSYRNVMEEVSSKLDKWSEIREKNIRNLQSALQKFSFLKRTTTGITLVSSTLELMVGFGTLMQSLFQFGMSPKYSLFTQVMSGLSITCSFSALIYSNHTVEDIVRDLREEKYLVRDIETSHRRGNWIDKELNDLFPHGIDLKLIAKMAFDDQGNLLESWQQHVCTAIIFCSVKKDDKLLYDEKFLASVKTFIKSNAAQVWINRVMLRSVLGEMTSKLENHPAKKTINGSEVFLNLAAINLYPLFFTVFCDSKKLQQTKLLWNSLAAISIANNLSDVDDCGFEDMKQTYADLQKDYRHIKKVTQNLFSDYD